MSQIQGGYDDTEEVERLKEKAKGKNFRGALNTLVEAGF